MDRIWLRGIAEGEQSFSLHWHFGEVRFVGVEGWAVWDG